MDPISILAAAGALILGVAGGSALGIFVRKRIGEKTIGSAEEKARLIEEEAQRAADATRRAAESARKEALIAAKEEALRVKNEAEREIKAQRADLAKTEQRLAKREESLDRKLENADKKDEQLQKKIKENEAKSAKIDELIAQRQAELERVSGYTAEEAKAELLAKIEEDARFESAKKLAEIDDELHKTAEDHARNIISLAIQRTASDQVAEETVAAVALPNDDMKGRIIGREGRNIRKIEELTGVDLIIDDTPETITVSCFDPVRRETARLALERLISDGRIHPARIEDTIKKVQSDIDKEILSSAEKAALDTHVRINNSELLRTLGRLRYRTSYGQNVLRHSIEVSYLAGVMAEELGLPAGEASLARRAGLLHDIGKAMTAEVEGSHVQIGVDLARKFKENADVIHAIEAHHGDVEPRTVVAMLVQAADALSAARPGARRENLENFVRRLQKLEEIAQSFPGVEKTYAIQAGREVRVMVRPEDVRDEGMPLLARQIASRIENELQYPGQIKVNIIRESRATDTAK